MTCSWKDNWETTKEHFRGWWKQDDLILCGTPLPLAEPREPVSDPGEAPDIAHFYTQPEWRARWNHHRLAHQTFPAEVLPVANTDIGPGSLALYLGGEAVLSDDTVWYRPIIDPGTLRTQKFVGDLRTQKFVGDLRTQKFVGDLRTQKLVDFPPLRFNPESTWWKIQEATLNACAQLARGKYAVGCPDIIENIDIVAALRDPQLLLMDLIDRPEWVLEKVEEVNQAFFEVYDRVYDIIKMEDGSSVFGAFQLWGPGKVVKVQCDASAMFSPQMFDRFVTPALTAQCAWLDCSLFHLDGHQCIVHLDLLLDIEPLDAIEWTPDPQVPSGGSPTWYPMYRKILEAGKSVQAIQVKPEEVLPLLDAVGGKGMYIMTTFCDEAHADQLAKAVEPYR